MARGGGGRPPTAKHPWRRRRCFRCVISLVGVALVAAWAVSTALLISLQVDKAKMTILREDDLEDLFFVQTETMDNMTAMDAEEQSVQDARKSASFLYRWLVPGSPRELLPWDEVLGDGGAADPKLANTSAPGHCGAEALALLAQGKIDEEACGAWANPKSDGCAAGFYEKPETATKNASLMSDDPDCAPPASKASSAPDGTFSPAGFSCYVACLYGASCQVSKLDEKNDTTKPHCSWPVALKHTDGTAYVSGENIIVCPGVGSETLCPPGYFASTPSKDPELCPKHHYCPRGTYKPIRCPFYTSCDEQGLDAPNVHLVAAAAFFLLFGVSTFLLQTSKFVRHRLRRLKDHVRDKRHELREQYLERRAARLADRATGAATSQIDSDDEEAMLRSYDGGLFCGAIVRGTSSYSDLDDVDESDDDVECGAAFSDVYHEPRRLGNVEMPAFDDSDDDDAGQESNSRRPSRQQQDFDDDDDGDDEKGDDGDDDDDRQEPVFFFEAETKSSSRSGNDTKKKTTSSTKKKKKTTTPLGTPRHQLQEGSTKEEKRLLRSLPVKSRGERVDIEFEQLGLSVLASSNGRPLRVLESVTCFFKAESATAILGPSGAGKSSLLKVCTSRLQSGNDILTPQTKILVNGDPAISLKTIAPLTAFVPQDDVMTRELAVTEILDFAAAMRLPNSTTRSSRRRLVRDVIAALGLKPVRHSVVGSVEKRGISGGQRKRVNVALELVADPCCMFADEPTSGLDSATSLEVVKVFRALAKKGATIAAVVHQPALQVWESFTDVLLLAPGGRTAYHGPPAGAKRHFEGRLGYQVPTDWSPSDYYMQLLVAQPYEIAQAWYERPLKDRAKTPTSRQVLQQRQHPSSSSLDSAQRQEEALLLEAAAASRAPPAWVVQLWLQTWRAFLKQRRVAASIACDVVVQTLAGGGIGLLYVDYAFKNAQLVNFMVSIALGMSLTLAGTPTFGKNRDVFLRECCNAAGGGLSPSAYFVANAIADVPRFAVLAVCFSLGFYPLAHPRASLGTFCLAAICDGFAASGFGYVASALFDETSALLAALCFALLFALFSGVHPTISQMGLERVIHYASHSRYFIEVLFIEEIIKMSEAFRMPPSFYASSSDSVLAQLLAYGYLVTDVSIYWDKHFLRWLDLGTLLAIGLAARLLAYGVLLNLNAPALGRESLFGFCRRICAKCLACLKRTLACRSSSHRRDYSHLRFDDNDDDEDDGNTPRGRALSTPLVR